MAKVLPGPLGFLDTLIPPLSSIIDPGRDMVEVNPEWCGWETPGCFSRLATVVVMVISPPLSSMLSSFLRPHSISQEKYPLFKFKAHKKESVMSVLFSPIKSMLTRREVRQDLMVGIATDPIDDCLDMLITFQSCLS